MPTAKRKSEAPAPAAEKPAGAVFLHEQIIAQPAEAGPDTAAVLAAQQAGHVIAGEAYVDRTEDVNGGVLVVWAVPVEAV